MKKAVSGIMLILLFIGSLVVTFCPLNVEAEPDTVYVRADGTIDPPTAPISSTDNVTYVLTGDVNSTVVWQRNNTILDGNGYDICPFDAVGLILSAVNNLTIQNTTIRVGSWAGVRVDAVVISSSSNLSISNINVQSPSAVMRISNTNNVTISDSEFKDAGILDTRGGYFLLNLSSYINIYRNNLTGPTGFSLYSSSFNILSGNNIARTYRPFESSLRLSNSNSNIFTMNNIEAGEGGVFSLASSANNTFCKNNFSAVFAQHEMFSLTSSANNTFFENNFPTDYNNRFYLSSSFNNKFYHNNFGSGTQSIDDSDNFWDNGYPLGGNYWSDYAGVDSYSGQFQNETGIDGIGDTEYSLNENNTDNFPLTRPFEHYLEEAPFAHFTYVPAEPIINQTTTFNASSCLDANGFIVSYYWDFGDGTNITKTDAIAPHVYTRTGEYTVKLVVTDNDGLDDNITQIINVVKIQSSISISSSSSSMYVGFKVNITGTLQDKYGNFLENETVVLRYSFSGIEEWVPITSDVTDNQGNYSAIWIPPATGYFVLKAEWAGNATYSQTSSNTTLSSLLFEGQYVFSVESNSTISELVFDAQDLKLSFEASGPDGTSGYVKITIAKSLVTDINNIEVKLDGENSTFSIISLADSWLLTFTYEHSTHQIEVDIDTTVIPDISTWVMFIVLIIATSAFAVYRRKD